MKALGRRIAATVTRGAVRCSAWLAVIGLFCWIVNAIRCLKSSGWFLGSDVRDFEADKLGPLAKVAHRSRMDHHGCIKCRERARREEQNVLSDEAAKRRVKHEKIPARLP